MDTVETLAFRKLLVTAAKAEASDLHLSVGSLPMMRVGGILQPLEEEETMTALILEHIVDSIIDMPQRERLEKNRDLVIMKVFDERIRAKVHIFYQEDMLTLSLRLLKLDVGMVRTLQIPKDFERFAELKNGLVIVGGHYGSGRTTLAMALLEHINQQRIEHIVTLEEPVEYDLVGAKSIVNQREVGRDVNSFEDGLASIEKEDVDVLLISDVSSPAAIRRTLELANAGVLVITIMDISSAEKALEKLLSHFAQHEQVYIRELLADALRGVVIQYLLPKIGGGLTSVHEVLLNTPTVRSFILSDRLTQLDGLIATSRREGMLSFDHELAGLVKSRAISLEHAREVSRNHELFESLVKGIFS
ncbi:MAG: ATPase, T2SS/T4P/T4SS family [Patescibacteria group bacterium]